MLAVLLHGDDVAPRFCSANQFMIAELDGGQGPAWPAAERRGRRPRQCFHNAETRSLFEVIPAQ